MTTTREIRAFEHLSAYDNSAWERIEQEVKNSPTDTLIKEEAKNIFRLTEKYFFNIPTDQKKYAELVEIYNQSIEKWLSFFEKYPKLQDSIMSITTISLVRSYIGLITCHYVYHNDDEEEKTYKRAIDELKRLDSGMTADLIMFLRIFHGGKIPDDITESLVWMKLIALITDNKKFLTYSNIMSKSYVVSIFHTLLLKHGEKFQQLTHIEKAKVNPDTLRLMISIPIFYQVLLSDQCESILGTMAIKNFSDDINILYTNILKEKNSIPIQSDLLREYDILQKLQNILHETGNLKNLDQYSSDKMRSIIEKFIPIYESIQKESSLHLDCVSTLLYWVFKLYNLKSLHKEHKQFEINDFFTVINTSSLVKTNYIDHFYINLITVRKILIENLDYAFEHTLLSNNVIVALINAISVLFNESESISELYGIINKCSFKMINVYNKLNTLVQGKLAHEKYSRTTNFLLRENKEFDHLKIDKTIAKNLETLKLIEKDKKSDRNIQIIQVKQFIQYIETHRDYLIKKYSKEEFEKLYLQHYLTLTKIIPEPKEKLTIINSLAPLLEKKPSELAIYSIQIDFRILTIRSEFKLGAWEEALKECDNLMENTLSHFSSYREAATFKEKINSLLLEAKKIDEVEEKINPSTTLKGYQEQLSSAIAKAKDLVQKQTDPLAHKQWWQLINLQIWQIMSLNNNNETVALSESLIKQFNEKKLTAEIYYFTFIRSLILLEHKNPPLDIIINDITTLLKERKKNNLTLHVNWEKFVKRSVLVGLKNIGLADKSAAMHSLQSIRKHISSSVKKNKKLLQLIELLWSSDDAFLVAHKDDPQITAEIKQVQAEIAARSSSSARIVEVLSPSEQKSEKDLELITAQEKIQQFLQKIKNLNEKNITLHDFMTLKTEKTDLNSLMQKMKLPVTTHLKKSFEKFNKLEKALASQEKKKELHKRKLTTKEIQAAELTQKITAIKQQTDALYTDVDNLQKAITQDAKDAITDPNQSILSCKEKLILIEKEIKDTLILARNTHHKNTSMIEEAASKIKLTQTLLTTTEKMVHDFYTSQKKISIEKKQAQTKETLSYLLKTSEKELKEIHSELTSHEQKLGELKPFAKNIEELNKLKKPIHILRLRIKSIKEDINTLHASAQEHKADEYLSEVDRVSVEIETNLNRTKKILKTIQKNNKLNTKVKKQKTTGIVKEQPHTKLPLVSSSEFFVAHLFPLSQNKQTIYEAQKSLHFDSEEQFIVHFLQALRQIKVMAFFKSSATAEFFMYHFNPQLKMRKENIHDNDLFIPFIENEKTRAEIMRILREFGFTFNSSHLTGYFLHYEQERELPNQAKRLYEVTLALHKDYKSTNTSHFTKHLAYLEVNDEKIDLDYPQAIKHTAVIRENKLSFTLLDHLNQFKTCVEKQRAEIDLPNPYDKRAKNVFGRAIKELLLARKFNITEKGPNLTKIFDKNWLTTEYLHKKLYATDPALPTAAFHDIVKLISEKYLSMEEATSVIWSFVHILLRSHCYYAHPFLLEDLDNITTRITGFLQILFKFDSALSDKLEVRFYFSLKYIIENLLHFSDFSLMTEQKPLPFLFFNPEYLFPKEFNAEMVATKYQLSKEEVLTKMEEPYRIELAKHFKKKPILQEKSPHTLFNKSMYATTPSTSPPVISSRNSI